MPPSAVGNQNGTPIFAAAHQHIMSLQPDATPQYSGSQPRSMEQLAEWHARAPAAEALEPALPIVDPHHHLFGTAADRHYFRLEDLQRELAGGHAIIGTVYCEAYYSGWRTTGPESLRPVGEVEQIVAATPSPVKTPRGECRIAAGIVASADLTLGEAVAEVLEAELAAGGGRLSGVRHHAATDEGTVGRFIKNPPRPHLLVDPAFRRGFGQLSRFGLAFDAWIYHTQLDELIDLTDAFPDTTIVLDHVGAPIGVAEYAPRRAAERASWERRMRALARRPNVRVKIGGMGMPVFGFGFEHAERPASAAELVQAWRPLIDVCIDAFGTERCMFESNFPVDRQSCSYTELWNAFKLATVALTPAERSNLFYRTACRAYRLPDLEAAGDRLLATAT